MLKTNLYLRVQEAA